MLLNLPDRVVRYRFSWASLQVYFSMSALASARVGTQPSLVQVPPSFSRSIRMTSAPSSRALRAAVTPAGPPAITTNSLKPSLSIASRPYPPRTSLLQVVVVEAVVLIEGLADLRRHLARGLGPQVHVALFVLGAEDVLLPPVRLPGEVLAVMGAARLLPGEGAAHDSLRRG